MATVGYSIGLDAGVFRYMAATFVIVIGLALALPPLQVRLAAASGPIANWTDQRFGSRNRTGLSGQFGVGVLLGAVWSPCVGPTLGAASLLAAQGQNLPQVAAIMFVFGIGGRTAAAATRAVVARGDDAMAQSPDVRRTIRQDGPRHSARRRMSSARALPGNKASPAPMMAERLRMLRRFIVLLFLVGCRTQKRTDVKNPG